MATVSLPFPSGRGTSRNSVVRFLRGLADGIRGGLALAARYDRLVCMSDSELARLGLRREDIARAALSSGRRR